MLNRFHIILMACLVASTTTYAGLKNGVWIVINERLQKYYLNDNPLYLNIDLNVNPDVCQIENKIFIFGDSIRIYDIDDSSISTIHTDHPISSYCSENQFVVINVKNYQTSLLQLWPTQELIASDIDCSEILSLNGNKLICITLPEGIVGGEYIVKTFDIKESESIELLNLIEHGLSEGGFIMSRDEKYIGGLFWDDAEQVQKFKIIDLDSSTAIAEITTPNCMNHIAFIPNTRAAINYCVENDYLKVVNF